MQFADVKKRTLHLWHTHATMSNVVLTIALIIAASWVWGTISTMQTNFAAQKAYEEQKSKLALTQLEVDTLKYQQNYYNSDEYKDLAARMYLGLVGQGEKVLVLPKNSMATQREVLVDTTQSPTATTNKTASESNFEQWLNFLSGANAQSLQN